MREKILVVDDEREIADLIELFLQKEGMEVYKFYSGQEALACIETTPLDLAILDVMLPDRDGFAICQTIRSRGGAYPVILLTARDGEIDRIMGLTLGADDYVTKPFWPTELMARVKAQLRRYKRYNAAAQEKEADAALMCGGLEMNVGTHEVRLNGQALALTPTEFSILRILLERRGGVVSAEELFHEIWREEYYSKNNNTITAHIRHLREKLGEAAPGESYIKTVWGVGYKIEG